MKKLELALGIYGVIITSLLLWAGFRNINTPSSMFVIPLLIIILIDYPLSLLTWSKFRKYRITLFIIGLLASTVILAAELLAVKTTKDLIFTLIFLPIFLYFLNVLVRDLRRWVGAVRSTNQKELPLSPIIVREKPTVEDENRRRFLKILAGAGFGAVLFSLINPQKVGAAFFGSMPGPGTIAIKDSVGTKIDPAIKSPTDSYGITNTSDSGDYPHYYGFEHYNGTEWYIISEASDGTFTYASKLNNTLVNYSTAWLSKASTLVFGTYHDAF